MLGDFPREQPGPVDRPSRVARPAHRRARARRTPDPPRDPRTTNTAPTPPGPPGSTRRCAPPWRAAGSSARGRTRSRPPRRRTTGATSSCRPAPRPASRWATCCPALTAIRAAAWHPWPARRRGALPLPDQGAGPGPARRDPLARGPTSGSRRTTATPRPRSASGPATTRSTCSPTPTCCTARCCPATRAGRRSSARCDYVVIDECHHYRGVFGSHVAAGAAPAAADLRALRRRPDVRARLGDGRRARRSRPSG